MNKYTVTIKAVYIQEVEIEADDDMAADKLAIRAFEPDADCLFSIDVFGLDPRRPTDGREDYEYETAINDSRRQIKIIKSSYYDQIMREFRTMIGNIPSYIRTVA